MVLMTISDARASLAEVVDQVRITGEPVYLTRRNKPIVALVDLAYLDALRTPRGAEVQVVVTDGDRESEQARRLAQMDDLFGPIQKWFKTGTTYPDSASDLYASRDIHPGDAA